MAGLDIEAVERACAARAADAALAAVPPDCECDPDAPQHPDSPSEQVERDCCPDALAQVAVDGKYLRGTADTGEAQEKLVSAFEPAHGISLAQARVGEGTNETSCFQPLLAPLDLTGTLISADAAHTNRANAIWLVEDKRAHYLLAIKADQPTMFAQVKNLEWTAVPDRSRRRRAAHGRWELRSMRTLELSEGINSMRDLRRIRVALPDLQSQRRYAELFTALADIAAGASDLAVRADELTRAWRDNAWAAIIGGSGPEE